MLNFDGTAVYKEDIKAIWTEDKGILFKKYRIYIELRDGDSWYLTYKYEFERDIVFDRFHRMINR